LLWVGILALKKFIVVGLIALAAALRRLFGGRSQESVASERTE
jgi:hypothetical protein